MYGSPTGDACIFLNFPIESDLEKNNKGQPELDGSWREVGQKYQE